MVHIRPRPPRTLLIRCSPSLIARPSPSVIFTGLLIYPRIDVHHRSIWCRVALPDVLGFARVDLILMIDITHGPWQWGWSADNWPSCSPSACASRTSDDCHSTSIVLLRRPCPMPTTLRASALSSGTTMTSTPLIGVTVAGMCYPTQLSVRSYPDNCSAKPVERPLAGNVHLIHVLAVTNCSCLFPVPDPLPANPFHPDHSAPGQRMVLLALPFFHPSLSA